MKKDYGFTVHGWGKGTPSSKNSNGEIGRTGSEAEVDHDGLCQSCLGVEPYSVDVRDPLMGFKWGETLDVHFRKTAVSIHAFTVVMSKLKGAMQGWDTG